MIVDTTVWIDYFRGTSNPEVEWLDREVARQPVGLTDLILCEVLQGVRDDRRFEELRRLLTGFALFSGLDPRTAVAAARNYRILRSRGRTIRRTIDCLIATFCLMHQYRLLHRDRDFEPFEEVLGLKVVRP